MKNILIYGALALATAACTGSRFATYSDYDRSMNVRNYESFNVIDSLAITAAGSSANPVLTNDFNRQRFVDAVRKQMVGRGYLESKDGQVHAILKMRSRNRTQSNYMPAYSPWGMGWYGGGYGGYGNTYTTSYEEILIAVDLREAASGRLLWQGVVGARQEAFTRNPEKNIPNAISDLYRAYPDGRPKSSYDSMDSGKPRVSNK